MSIVMRRIISPSSVRSGIWSHLPLLTELEECAAPIYKNCAPPEQWITITFRAPMTYLLLAVASVSPIFQDNTSLYFYKDLFERLPIHLTVALGHVEKFIRRV